MDQSTLVEKRIDEGQQLLGYLAVDGLEMSAACWVKRSEEPWRLYVVSKVVEEQGLAAAYRSAQAALQRLADPWTAMAELKFLGPSNRLAVDILHLQSLRPSNWLARVRSIHLGGRTVEEAYLYPPQQLTALKDNPKVQENVTRFLTQGWVLDGKWEDGYPCVQLGRPEAGFLYRLKVDEDMTPEKVPYLEGKTLLPGSGTDE